MAIRRTRAFTLVELMVVMSIISIMMAILLPSLTRAREQARRARCMANLHSMGQAVHIYANEYDGALVPGDSALPWAVWAVKSEGPDCGTPAGSKRQPVNLGYLLKTEILPVPTDNDSVVFCPSARNPDGSRPGKGYRHQWGSSREEALITYMYNVSLDGFGPHIQGGEHPVLSHVDVVNHLLSDGSVQKVHIRREIYHEAAGPEYVYEAAARRGVCFPSAMVHNWLEDGAVNPDEAADYFADPLAWITANRPPNEAATVALAHVPNRSLAADVMGAWGGIRGGAPSPPPG